MKHKHQTDYIDSLYRFLDKSERFGEDGEKYIIISDKMTKDIVERLMMISNQLK